MTNSVAFLLLLLLLFALMATLMVAEMIPDFERIDCYPKGGTAANERNCKARGCLWAPAAPNGPPWCFFDPKMSGYKIISKTACANCHDQNFYIELEPIVPDHVIYDPPIKRVLFTAKVLNEHHLNLKFVDMDNEARYQVPFENPDFEPSQMKPWQQLAVKADFVIGYRPTPPFSFRVVRRSTRTVLFDMRLGGFVFSDRFLQLTTTLASRNFYGLGEHEHDTLKHDLNYKKWPIFSRDELGLGVGKALYGAHPFYMVLEDDGNAHGVFLKNSNAMEFELIPAPGVIMRTTGGILDLHIYTGPTPENVIQQHTEYVGRPHLPPYWSLGFSIGRWGYKNVDNVNEIIRRNVDKNIPFDAIFLDMDYMAANKDFTLNGTNFRDLPNLITTTQQSDGRRFVLVLLAGLPNNDPNYEAAKHIGEKDGFVKKADNSGPMLGQVHGNVVAYPDFFNNKTIEIWQKLVADFSKNTLKFDGLWLTLNEPTNMDNHCPNNEDPPYSIFAENSNLRLSDKTICMTARHDQNGHHQLKHYDVHNVYGLAQSIATVKGVEMAYPNKRPFVMSRSTYPGSGRYVSHWLGDNVGDDWHHLRRSIIGMLEMNMFGIPQTGANICGYMRATNVPLCKRWHQLGAFYPLSRNYNNINEQDKDPAGISNPDVYGAAEFWMKKRYELLPYLYTLFYEANTRGGTVARPLFHEFPTDVTTWDIDKQFMLGSAVLVVPNLFDNPNYQPYDAYMPKDIWVDLATGALHNHCNDVGGHKSHQMKDPFMNVFQRGGTIMVTQPFSAADNAAKTTKYARQQPLTINVVFGCDGKATGKLFWDDGESAGTIKDGKYWLISYHAYYDDTTVNVTVSSFLHESTDSVADLAVKDLKYQSIVMSGLTKQPTLPLSTNNRRPPIECQKCPETVRQQSVTMTSDIEKMKFTVNFNGTEPMKFAVYDFTLNLEFTN